MANIYNRNIPAYDLDHVYVADCGDDNIHRHMLREAMVSQVIIDTDGIPHFYFDVADKDAPMASSEMEGVYYNTDSYKNNGIEVDLKYKLTTGILASLGVTSDVYDIVKANPNASQLIVAKGFVVNDDDMVEPVEFPSRWIFTKKVVETTDSSGIVSSAVIWEHNANFNGKHVFATRGDAFDGHKIKLMKLDGTVEEV